MGRFDDKEKELNEANKPIKMGIWIAFGLGGFTTVAIMYFIDSMARIILGD